MRLNANYQLPAARPVWVKAPGEAELTLATCPPQAANQELINVYFPQCPLVSEKFPDLQLTEVPANWLQAPLPQPAVQPDEQALPEVREHFLALAGVGYGQPIAVFARSRVEKPQE